MSDIKTLTCTRCKQTWPAIAWADYPERQQASYNSHMNAVHGQDAVSSIASDIRRTYRWATIAHSINFGAASVLFALLGYPALAVPCAFLSGFMLQSA